MTMTEIACGIAGISVGLTIVWGYYSIRLYLMEKEINASKE